MVKPTATEEKRVGVCCESESDGEEGPMKG